jgi:hypothetical protein
MQKRPLSVTVIAWIFIVTGAVGLMYHLREFDLRHPLAFDSLWVSLIRVMAILAGAYILRGKNWARWLALLWMLFHVVLSAFHSIPELAVHAVLLLLFGYFLLRPQARGFFVVE